MNRVGNVALSQRICCKSVVSQNGSNNIWLFGLPQIPIVQGQHFHHTFSSKPVKAEHLSQQNVLKRNFFKNALSDDIKDHHPEKGKLVYVGSLSKMVKIVKGFSVSTSGVGLALQPYIYTASKEVALPLALKIATGGFINFFIFLTPVLLHLVTKRYITYMYYNAESGRFYCNTLTFFLRNKEHSFTVKEVTVPTISGLFTTFLVNGKPLFVDPSLFLDNDVLIKLLGYDKPIDFTLHDLDNDDDKKKT